MIKLLGIKKFFDQKKIIDINLSVKTNEFISIVGKSGSGKSTLLNILGLIDSEYKGEYYFNGQKINQLDNMAELRLNDIGFIFQSYNLIDGLTAQENIKLPLKYKKEYDEKDIEKWLEKIVQRLNIKHILDKKVNVLSGGEKQRVGIARALILKPKVLLADEPTGNLDLENTQYFLELMYEMKEITTIIMITHNLELALKADKVYVLENGELHEKK